MYLIKACPHNHFAKTVVQEAATERLRNKWLAVYAKNNWDILGVEYVNA